MSFYYCDWKKWIKKYDQLNCSHKSTHRDTKLSLHFAWPIVFTLISWNNVEGWKNSIHSERKREMEFFKEMRIFFVFFISLGFWTTWQNGEFKFLLRLCSAFSMVLKFLFFSSAIIFDKLYGFDSLSNTVANVLFVFSALTHFVIVLETIFSDEAQKKLIQQLSAVDHLLTTKLQMKITYQHEKRTIFIHMLILASSKILTNVIIVIYYSGTESRL